MSEQAKQNIDDIAASEPATMKACQFSAAKEAVFAAQSLMEEAALLGRGGLLRQSIVPTLNAVGCLERATDYLRTHCVQVRDFDQRSKSAAPAQPSASPPP